MILKIKALEAFGKCYEWTWRHNRVELQLQSSTESGRVVLVLFVLLG